MASLAPRGVDVKEAKRQREMRAKYAYPWDEWLNGQPWQLTEGEDYGYEQTLRSAAQRAAKTRGMRVRVERNHNSAGRPGVILQRIEN